MNLLLNSDEMFKIYTLSSLRNQTFTDFSFEVEKIKYKTNLTWK